MRICYLDESGTPELAGRASHFVLLGVSVLVSTWKAKDAQLSTIKGRFGLRDAEIHTGWMVRRYVEQEKIGGFEAMGEAARRTAMRAARDAFLVSKAARKGLKSVQEDRRTFAKSDAYIHLTYGERIECLRQIADAVAGWGDCRLFAEATDKQAFGGKAPKTPPFEEGFTQVVTRFQRFLETLYPQENGLLVQDKNETVSQRLTELMRSFHKDGTRWRPLHLIVETPLFVDSHLTSMVQVADLCAYATRRFVEQGERDLFDRILPRFNTAADGRLVGVRHYTGQRRCACEICRRH